MNPEPAMQANQPFVMDGRIWRRIVIAIYLASSCASAVIAPGFEHDLVWIPELVWSANAVIVLAAIALVRTRAPLRLQLALAFASPMLYVVLLSGLSAYSGEDARIWNHIQMFVILFYSSFLGSVVAFGIALASHRTSMQPGVVIQRPVGSSAFPRMFSALGWGLVATWVYIHGFELVASLPGSRPYLDGLLLRILDAAVTVGWLVSPLWVVGAIALVVSSFRRKQRPALAETAVLVLVTCLMGLFLALGFLLD